MYMESTTKQAPRTNRYRKALPERLSDVQAWCLSRGINQVYAFFKGCDPVIAAHEARIRFVLRNAHAPELVPDDALWMVSMEATIAALNNRKSAA